MLINKQPIGWLENAYSCSLLGVFGDFDHGMAVWHSGSALVSINEVTLWRAWLVL